MSRVRILFVDDDPSILRSFRVLFWKDRDRWEVVLAPSAEAAQLELSRGAFDLIVSDMRMPGMNGTELLELVKREWPTTLRIMLSGSADRDDHVRAMAVVDELISKPCDGKTLRGRIEELLLRGTRTTSDPEAA